VRGRWQTLIGRAPRAALLVLPEVFGVNAWMCSVADSLAAPGRVRQQLVLAGGLHV
jgi:hypothetical protein